MKQQPLDKYLEDSFKQLQATIAQVGKEEAALTRAGCVLAYAHVKNGTCKMYLRAPSSEDRAYTYVGIDEQNQLDALARIDRYQRRELARILKTEIESTKGELAERLRELNDELRFLLSDAKDAVAEAQENLKEFQKKPPARLREWRDNLVKAAQQAKKKPIMDDEDEQRPARRGRPAAQGQSHRALSQAHP